MATDSLNGKAPARLIRPEIVGSNPTPAPNLNAFTDANGMLVREGDEVQYRFGARHGILDFCGHDGSAWVSFFDNGRSEDVNWKHLCGVPEQYRQKK